MEQVYDERLLNEQNDNNEEKDSKRDKKEKIMLLLIFLLIILLIVGIGVGIYGITHQKTAIISTAEKSAMHDTRDGQIRIRIASSVTVENDTMQNLEFENVNKNRLMKCKIKLADSDDYCYSSQYINPGEKITADVIDTKGMKSGENNAIAELYTYNTKTKEQIGHVNVKMVLYLK